MTDVEVAVRLWREAGDDCHAPAFSQVGSDYLADEIAVLGWGLLVAHKAKDTRKAKH